MREVIFHRLASEELLAAVAWYAQRSESTRERFRREATLAVERIVADPESCPILGAPYRFARLRHFPFLLIYEIRAGGAIFVVAVAHASRRPNYWRRRG